MENCSICEKDLDHGYKTVDIYSAHLIKRGVNKGKMGSSIASEYGKFVPTTEKVCNRHLRGFWTQRFIPGAIAFVLLFIPIVTLVSLIPIWNDNRSAMVVVGMLIAMVPVTLLVRRITYDAYVASLLTLNPKNRAEKLEFVGQAKYRRIMRNLSRLDSVLKENNRRP